MTRRSILYSKYDYSQSIEGLFFLYDYKEQRKFQISNQTSVAKFKKLYLKLSGNKNAYCKVVAIMLQLCTCRFGTLAQNLREVR